ncbi:MAG: hypothetical protein Kow0013_12000 [Pararhodobacter sp.]
MPVLDHLAVAVEDLDSGTRRVAELLGVPFESGGHHAAMGTHNRLLSLGPEEYLEVIVTCPPLVPHS